MPIDNKGRCCGRKPIHYKGGGWNSPYHPKKFCTRCAAEYDPLTGEQRENFARWAHWAHGTCGAGCVAGNQKAYGTA